MNLITEIKNYFFRETKSSQSLSLTDAAGWSFFGLSRKNTRINYGENSAFDAYRAHELVFACINKMADVANDAEIIVEKKNNKGEWKRVDGHPLTALFKRPNKLQTGRDIRKLLIQSEQSAGRFCLILNRSRAAIPVEMEAVNPNRLQPKWNDARTEVLYYEYIRKDGKRIPVKTEDVLIRRRPDLVDQFNGFAPILTALKSVNSDLGLTDYIDAFFESDGTPSGILKILNASVSKTQAEALQADWKRKYGRNGANQKGVAVLDQNAEFQRLGSNLDELASDSLGDRFESRICSVFGVPPILVGALVGLRHTTNNATAKAALRDFWDNKVSPELAVFREWLTWFVLPEFENMETIKAEQIRVGFDLSNAAFLQEDINEIHSRARENVKAGFWTINEARTVTGQKPDPKGDYYLRISVVTPENRAQQAEEVPMGTDPKQLTDGQENPKKLPEPQKKTFDFDGLTLAREPRGVELLINLKSLVSDFENEKEKAVKTLNNFRNDLIAQATKEIENLATQDVYTLVLSPNAKITKQITKTLRDSYKRGRKQIIEEINAQKSAKNQNDLLETKDLFDDDEDGKDFIDELINVAIVKVINEIQSRAVNWFVILKTLGNYTADLLKEKLLGESTKFVEQTAGNMVNASIRTGRDAEIKNLSDEWKYVEYSAILDANTCSPCKTADGKTANDPDDLPDAPNPDCEGGPNCRCFIVAVVE